MTAPTHGPEARGARVRGRVSAAFGALLLAGAAVLPSCGAAPTAPSTPAASKPSSSAPTAKPSSTSASTSKSAPASATKSGSTSSSVQVPSYCHAGAAAVGFGVTAAEQPDASVRQWNGACWAAIPFTPMSRPYSGSVPAGDAGQFKVAWSTAALYALAWVREWPLHSHGVRYGDTVSFYFEGDNATDPTYGPAACDDGITWFGSGTAGTTCHLYGYHLYLHVVQQKGYYAELTVPWKTLRVSKPAAAQRYAFTIAFSVADSSGALVGGQEWAGTGRDIDQETLHWGTITLG